jgi:hypothetical protein
MADYAFTLFLFLALLAAAFYYFIGLVSRS